MKEKIETELEQIKGEVRLHLGRNNDTNENNESTQLTVIQYTLSPYLRQQQKLLTITKYLSLK